MLTVVIPVYNEAPVLPNVISKVAEQLTELRTEFEIIVVDDGSTDGSAERVRELQHARVRLIRHPYNIGNGAAVRSGIRAARGEQILLMDGDGQHRAEDIPALLEFASSHNMVVGNRKNGRRNARRAANAFYNMLASYVTRFRVEDLTSGFRVLDTDLARSCIHLLPNTFSYPTTLTLAALRGGFSVRYVPISAPDRIGKSKIKPTSDGMRFLLIIMRIAVLVAPLRVFVPLSGLFFALGFGWYIYRVFFENRTFPPVSSLLLITSVLVFLIGLISEQINYLRHEGLQARPSGIVRD